MSFEKVIGQEHVRQIFENILSNNRLAHAYIFAGPMGVGKFTFAKELAKRLLCGSATGCQKCKACQQVEHNQHPNLKIIQVEEGRKSIRINAIREMEKEIMLRPFQGQYKIFIINDAELMEETGFNALLKTLEEPPEHSLIILVSAKTESLLPTVYSRCQIVRFRPIREEVLVPFFQEKLNLEPEEVKVLVYLSDGSIGWGFYLSQQDFVKQRDWLIEHLLEPDRHIIDSMLDYSKQSTKTQEEVRNKIIQQFKIIGLFLRDVLLLVKGVTSKEYLLNQDKFPWLERFKSRYSVERIYQALESLLEGERYIRLNANVKLVVENTILNIGI